MTWASQLTRIRRHLRDPSGDIWSDAFLRRQFNDEQQEWYVVTGQTATVAAVQLPPEVFQTSYCHDWEWAFSDNADGPVLQFLRYYDPEDVAFCYAWEPQSLIGGSGQTDVGDVFAHPWEAWMTSTPGDQPAIALPDAWDRMLMIAWDRWPLDASTKKETVLADPSYKTRYGRPKSYRRDDKLENVIYLDALPSVVWPDPSITLTYTSGSEQVYFADPDGGDILLYLKPGFPAGFRLTVVVVGNGMVTVDKSGLDYAMGSGQIEDFYFDGLHWH